MIGGDYPILTNSTPHKGVDSTIIFHNKIYNNIMNIIIIYCNTPIIIKVLKTNYNKIKKIKTRIKRQI